MNAPISNVKLRSLRFRLEREASWQELERLLSEAERRRPTSLHEDDMIAIPTLYRAALSSLSVARATSLDQALIDYLEALCARAYFFVYGARMTLGEWVEHFFQVAWPNAVRSLWRETIVSFLLVFAGAATAYALVSSDPDWYSSFISSDMAGGREPTASTDFLRETIYGDGNWEATLIAFATFLFTHNSQIALFSFALGFAFCLPTSLLMAYNGAILGAMFALFASRDLGYEFGGWIFIHGVTELFAVILAGAAGLRVGWSIAFPGDLDRIAAAEHAGREGAIVIIGVIVMLIVAGLLEGIGRQVVTSDEPRWLIAIGTAVGWGLYFYGGRRRENVHG